MSGIVAKLTVQEITYRGRNHDPDHDESPDENYQSEQLKFSAIYDQDEDINDKWAHWTPSANLDMTIDNPDAQRKFKAGQKVRVIIEPID